MISNGSPRGLSIKRTYKHFGFCCGLGSGAAGFNDSVLQIANMIGNWRCIGGVDIDQAGLADFEQLTGTKGTMLDLFTREQYIAFHGEQPPADWKEAGLDDIRRAAGGEDPDAVFISSPCKGASGLLPESMSVTPKYMALNELTLRCVWLMLEAWAHNPVKLIVFENVPRLASRGRYLLDQIVGLFRHYGYAVEETVHDCGKIAGGKGVQGGWQSVADPRVLNRKKGDSYLTGGHYGVVSWNSSAGAVSASARHDNGRWSVADTRLPAANDRVTCVIRSMHDTWNRPFTTLELAALQSMFDPEDIWQPNDETGALELVGKQFILHGNNDGAWRERIGNAVPRKAGKAIADVMLSTLMLSEMGETFTLNAMPVWCQPLAMAISMSRLQQELTA